METTRKRQERKSHLRAVKNLIKNYSKVVYSTLSIFFFLANYHICNFYYPLDTEEHVSNWWILKVNIYVLIIALCYLSLISKSSNNKRVKFVEDFMISFGVGFACSNFIDRWVFDDRFFSWSSYYPLLIIAFVSYWNVKKINKKAEELYKNLTDD